jgi:hypothetical protein
VEEYDDVEQIEQEHMVMLMGSHMSEEKMMLMILNRMFVQNYLSHCYLSSMIMVALVVLVST